jgi:periplasmic divalent cation tolerance protein
MAEYIEIHWTSGSIDEARKISRFLVQEGYVACAQITPWIESIYLWNGQLETTQETSISLKSRIEHYEKIKKIIQENCTYQVPQITYQHIDGGNEEYLSWLQESTSRQHPVNI